MSTKRLCDFCGQEIVYVSNQYRTHNVIRHDDRMDYSLSVRRQNVGAYDSQADFHHACALAAFIGANDGPSWPPAVVAQYKEEA